MIQKFDFLVIGGGIAGMSYALSVAKSGKGKVALVCKTTLDETNTTKAQGGVAAVTNLDVDNFEKHINDTIIAGDYISDLAAVKHVVCNAAWNLIRTEKESTICTAKADTATFAFCTMPTILGSRYNAD